MEKENSGKLKKILYIFLLVAVVAIAIVSTIVLNIKKRERDDLQDKNDQIPIITMNLENF